MIVKFLSSKKAKGLKAVDYVLSEKRHKGYKPRVLEGSPKITQNIIKNIKYKQKATFGVLSFEEDNIPEDEKKYIMKEFEKVILPGLKKNRNYNILWVEHRDKGRLELNFIIPKVELTTGKSLNPYFDKADRTRLNQWRRIINIEHGFSDPEDLEKAHTISKHKVPKINEMAIKLNQKILNNIDILKSQKEIVDFINSLQGMRAVVPKSKAGNYINVYFPGSNRGVKFKGGVYENNYTDGNLGEVVRKARDRIARQKKENGRDRIKALREELENSINKKMDYLFTKYNIDDNVDNRSGNLYNAKESTIDEMLETAKIKRELREKNKRNGSGNVSTEAEYPEVFTINGLQRGRPGVSDREAEDTQREIRNVKNIEGEENERIRGKIRQIIILAEQRERENEIFREKNRELDGGDGRVKGVAERAGRRYGEIFAAAKREFIGGVRDLFAAAKKGIRGIIEGMKSRFQRQHPRQHPRPSQPSQQQKRWMRMSR